MFAAHTTDLRRLRPSRPAAFFAALVVFIIVILVAAPQAQQAPLFAPSRGAATVPREALPEPATEVDLLVGRSTILNVGSAITRVSLTVPDIADAMVTTPTQLLIHGKSPGTISLFVWDRGGTIRTYEVNVRRDLKALVEQMKQLFPGEPITVAGSGKDVVISGIVSGQYVIDKAADVAAGYVDKKENVVNLLKQQEGVASNQVMLRVRFAEVSRSALQELGASLFTGPAGFHDYVSRVTTQQFPSMGMGEVSQNVNSTEGAFRVSTQGAGKWGGDRDTVVETGGKGTFSDLLNLFLFNNRYNVGTLIRAMQEKGLFQSLAEPNLIATNGKEASFLAGGEYPYPVIQAGGTNNSVTIMFKEFGIRLSFTPTVLGGDLINLKVKPEVSALDFSNAITLEGFRIPALSTRRTETEVELRDGQTFAIAGLLNNSVTDTMRKIPGIGDIPILGWLFKSKALQKQQTELVVMITPTIVRRGSMGVSEALPSEVEPFIGRPVRSLPPPEPYVGSPRYPASKPAPRSGGDMQPEPQPQASATPAVPGSGQQATRDAQSAVAKPADANAPLPSHTVVAQPQQLVTPPPPQAAPVTRPLTKEEKKTLERAREEERKASAAAEQLQAEQARIDAEARLAAAAAEEQRKAEQARIDAEQARKDAEQRSQVEKLEKERAAREAIVAKRNAELARKKAEQDQKREKALAEAAARLKQAQAAYQAELDRAKGGTNDKTKDPGKTSPSPAPRN
jgi:pilus assembly protein CpaC